MTQAFGRITLNRPDRLNPLDLALCLATLDAELESLEAFFDR